VRNMNGVCFTGGVSEIITRNGESFSLLAGKHWPSEKQRQEREREFALSAFENRTRGIIEARLAELALLMKKVN